MTFLLTLVEGSSSILPTPPTQISIRSDRFIFSTATKRISAGISVITWPSGTSKMSIAAHDTTNEDPSFNVVELFACARPLTRPFLPLPPSFLFEHKVDDSKEVEDEEGNKEDTDAAAKDIDAAATNDAATNNDDYATMPPKVKPIPARKTATKRESANIDEMPPTAPRIVANFSVDSNNKFLVSYYCEGSHDNVDVVREHCHG